MMALLLIAALISALLGDALEAGALMVSVGLVIGISLFQVRRTDKALAALGVTDILLISLCAFPAVVWFELHKLRVRTKAPSVTA